jgi:cyclopropane-fatty-acyl-phospholipid synthase
MAAVDRLIETGRVPEAVLRAAIRANCAARLRHERRKGPAERRRLIAELAGRPIAEQPSKANEQHYEVPSRFFELVLGPRLKYSACYWPDGVGTLAEAEEAMLALTCERAGIEDGMELLDLGCGWGSLTTWLAERYPSSHIVALSNSHGQRAFIESRSHPNVEVRTCDVSDFDPGRRFDRIVSVEMLEHMRNYELLLGRVASWLAPDGRFFCHVFSHRRHAYLYDRGWMARTFFTAGTMPSDDLLPRLAHALELEDRWQLSGTHYARTAEAWLDRMEANCDEVLDVLEATYGTSRARGWYANWRVFFLACAELWGYRGGSEWIVSHYRFAKK